VAEAETTTAKQRHGFQPGQSGNPAGRPKGSHHKAIEALDLLGRNASEEILLAVINAAKSGDARSAELVLRRIWPERTSRPVPLDLPSLNDAAGVVQAIARIAEATASGEISPEEAAGYTALAEAQRKALETADLEVRIAALEASQK
jgi:hypothetical protein